MPEVYYARPVVATDDRVRDALEKQQRQRALREELDSQREAQRAARERAGLPSSNEPMTRAQRHRQRVAQEQEEMRRLESEQRASAPGGAPQFAPEGTYNGRWPGVPPPAAAGVGFSPSMHPAEAPAQPSEPLNGTYGRQGGAYAPVRQSTTSLPAIGRTSSQGLPPMPNADSSPRYAPPPVPGVSGAVPPSYAGPDAESVYGWQPTAGGAQPQHSAPFQPPTPPQQPAEGTYQRARPMDADPSRLDGTLSRAPPPNATQQELALWLSQATEEIRKARGEQTTVPADAPPRGRGPATRGAEVQRASGAEVPKGRAPSSQQQRGVAARGSSRQRDTSSRQRDSSETRRVAKLEATLAGQAEAMKKMQGQQKDWQSQVDRLNRELKNARDKEKVLTKAVIEKQTKVPKQRAETAPKPALPAAARGGKRDASKERRPITAGVELEPMTAELRARQGLPPIPDDLQQSYASKRGLPTPRGGPLSPRSEDDDASVVSPKASGAKSKRKKQQPVPQGPSRAPQPSSSAPPEPSATLTFAQLLKFTESKMLTHKQVQQLWEVFSGASSRATGVQHGRHARQELAPDEDFDVVETVETYEDLQPDDDDD